MFHTRGIMKVVTQCSNPFINNLALLIKDNLERILSLDKRVDNEVANINNKLANLGDDLKVHMADDDNPHKVRYVQLVTLSTMGPSGGKNGDVHIELI